MWQETENSLYTKIKFQDFDAAFEFLEKVADAARQMDHHPKISNEYNIVELWLSTHSAGGTVTEKDRELAGKIEAILQGITDVTILSEESTSGEPEVSLPEAKLYADGGSRGNPGPSAYGYAILDPEDNVVKKEGSYLGVTTNNQAEYQALKAGLKSALELGVKKLHVYMDSLLVINQVQGIWKIKNQELGPHHRAIKELIKAFDQVTLTHVPRALNTLADSMVNECLDAQADDAAVIN